MKNKIFVLLALFIFSCDSNSEEINSEDNPEVEIEYKATGLISTPIHYYNNITTASIVTSSGNSSSSYDLSPYMPPVRSQGNQGSCASWATGYYLSGYYQHIESEYEPFGTGNNFDGAYSPSFLYNLVKIDGCQDGSTIYDNLELLKNKGTPEWNDFPYTDDDCDTDPYSQIGTACGATCLGAIYSYHRLHTQNTNFELSDENLIYSTKEFLVRNEPSARRLQRMLQSLGLKAEVMLHSVEESIDWFQNNQHPDLIFLDIQLSDGLSFEIFETIDIKSAIIFTTAYDEYALQAFKLNSIDYLLKPIDEDDLATAVKKYQERAPQKQAVTLDFNDIKKLLVNPLDREYKKRFSVKVGQHLKLINIDEIECFYSQNKGTYVHTTEGRNYLLDTTLEHLADELEPQTFYRINRKFFVNINAIKDMISYTNSRLQVKLNSYNEQEVIVARERVKDFKAWLE